MDNLDYNYIGNQLAKVDDTSGNIQGFKDGNTSNNDYSYDQNGNILKDLNKNITSINYNHLNLPRRIEFGTAGADGAIVYIYDATGVKLAKKVQSAGSNSSLNITLYGGDFNYLDNNLQFIRTSEGYVEPPQNSNTTFKYVYQYKDQLDNIRLSYSDDNKDGNLDVIRNNVDIDGDGDLRNEIVEEHNYFPFGLKHLGYNNLVTNRPHKYRFQEQEEQDELGLNWIQFKWRNHDPATGRFMNIDPLTEEYRDWGPYVFSGNRVIDARELEGLEPHSVHKTHGEAAQNFAIQYNGMSIRAGREIGTKMYKGTDKEGNVYYSYTTPVLGAYGFCEPDTAEDIPDGTVKTHTIHTHGNDDNMEMEGLGQPTHTTGSNYPSPGDFDRSDEDAKDNPDHEGDYQVGPNGTIWLYVPSGKRGDDRMKDTTLLPGSTKVTPSDPNSNTRKNNVSPNNSPDVLPLHEIEDYHEPIPEN